MNCPRTPVIRMSRRVGVYGTSVRRNLVPAESPRGCSSERRIAPQGSIEKWDNLFDYRFGCLFWQQMTTGYVKSAHVVRPTAPDIGRCQRAGFHPAGNKPFISPEHHYGT